MLQEVLKQATKKNHDELEQLMYVNDIMSGELTVQQYKQILSTNYEVHKTLEDLLFNDLGPNITEKLDLEHRHKIAALQTDMQEIGIPVTAFEYQPLTFEISKASILGAMYVLEGATLGGSVIVKRLKTNPKFTDLNLGFHYYQVYGTELVTYWKNFCEVLNSQPEDTYDKSIDGAKKVFEFIAATQIKNNQLV